MSNEPLLFYEAQNRRMTANATQPEYGRQSWDAPEHLHGPMPHPLQSCHDHVDCDHIRHHDDDCGQNHDDVRDQDGSEVVNRAKKSRESTTPRANAATAVPAV